MSILVELPVHSGMFRSWQTEYDTRRWSRIDKFVLHPKFIEYNKVGNADFEKSKGNLEKLLKVGKNIYFSFRAKGFSSVKLVNVFILRERISLSIFFSTVYLLPCELPF